VLKRHSDVVEPLQQALALERIDLEAQSKAGLVADPLSFEIRVQFITLFSPNSLEQLVDLRFGQGDRSIPFLKQLL
jgi:hypothetical protein